MSEGRDPLLGGEDAENSSVRARVWHILCRDALAALIGPFALLPYALFYADIVFADLRHGFTSGFLQVLYSVVVANVVSVGFRMSQMREIIVAPDVTAAFFLQRIAVNIGASLTNVSPDIVVGHVLLASAAYSALAGAVFALASVVRLTSLTQFVPFQVTGGFIAGMGLLTLKFAVTMGSGSGNFQHLLESVFALCRHGDFEEGVIIANGCLCVAWSLLLRLVMYSTDGSPFVLPSLIGLTCIVFQIVVWASGYSEADAQNAGWLISELLEVPVHWWSEMSLISSPLFLEFHPWAIFNAQNLNIWLTMTVMLLLNGSFNMISATKALGVASRVDLNREIRILGIITFASSFAGGLECCHSFGNLLISKTFNARTRWTPALFLGVYASLYFFAPTLIGYVPRFVTGGVLFSIGTDMCIEWLFASYARIARKEWIILVSIATTIVAVGLMTGVIMGLLMSLVYCVDEYRSVTGVVSEDTMANCWSHVERPEAQRKSLLNMADQVRIFWLEGYFFFGSANTLVKTVQTRIGEGTLRYVVLDLSRVPAIDASGVFALVDFCESASTPVVLCGMTRRLRVAFSNAQGKNLRRVRECSAAVGGACVSRALSSIGAESVRSLHLHGPDTSNVNESDPSLHAFDNLDLALEWIEEVLLTAMRVQEQNTYVPLPPEQRVVQAVLQEVGDPALAQAIAKRGQLLDFLRRGKLLCREGTDADRVFFLVSGSISTSTSIAPGVGRKKAMDRRHLNLEKGDEFTQNRRQHKYRDHGAVCVVEFAGQLHSCLQSMMSAEDGTVVISVQFTVLEQLSQTELGNALSKWINRRLVAHFLGETGINDVPQSHLKL